MLVLHPGVPATRSVHPPLFSSSSHVLFDVIHALYSFCSFSLSSPVLLCGISIPRAALPPPSPHPHLFPPPLLFGSIYLTPLSCLLFSLQGNTIESEHLSELTEEEYEAHIYQRQDLKGFMWLDAKYLNPFFTRRLTQEVREKSSELPGEGRGT